MINKIYRFSIMTLMFVPGAALLLWCYYHPNQGAGSGRVFLAGLLLVLAVMANIVVRIENALWRE